MLVDPRIQVKAVEGDPLFAHWDDGQPRSDVPIEHATSDAAVRWRIAIADQTRLRRFSHCTLPRRNLAPRIARSGEMDASSMTLVSPAPTKEHNPLWRGLS